MDFSYILAPILLVPWTCALFYAARKFRRERTGKMVRNIAVLVLILNLLLVYNVYRVNLNESLWIAVQSGNYEEAKRLLRSGADPQGDWEDGSAAIANAAKANRKDLVQLLLDFHANPDGADDSGKKARELATDPEIRALLDRAVTGRE